MDPSKKVSDLNCEVQDLLLEVVDFKQEVPDLRSGGIHPNLALPLCNVIRNKNVQKERNNVKNVILYLRVANPAAVDDDGTGEARKQHWAIVRQHFRCRSSDSNSRFQAE